MKLELHIGALAPKLSEQLESQGLVLKNIDYYEKVLESRVYLFMGGFMTESENKKVVERVFKEISKKVKSKGGE